MEEPTNLSFFVVFLHVDVDEMQRVVLVLERLISGVQFRVVALQDCYPLLQSLALCSRLGQSAKGTRPTSR